jgi:hypothetical protein
MSRVLIGMADALSFSLFMLREQFTASLSSVSIDFHRFVRKVGRETGNRFPSRIFAEKTAGRGERPRKATGSSQAGMGGIMPSEFAASIETEPIEGKQRQPTNLADRSKASHWN